MLYNRQNIGLILCAWLTILTCFGASCIAIYRDQPSYSVQPCPSINLTLFSAEKDIFSIWSWKYDFKEFNGNIEYSCPTLKKGNVNVYVDGKLAGKSESEWFSLYDEIHVFDCSGTHVSTIRTGNVFQTWINNIKIWVDLEIRNPSGSIIAYSSGQHFINDDIEIVSANSSEVIGSLYRDIIDIEPTWKFTMLDDGVDLLTLSVLAGHQSFKDSFDACNNYFWITSWTVLTLTGLTFFVGVFGLLKFRHWKHLDRTS